MAIDGKLLARARDRLSEIRQQNQDEALRRQSLVYSRSPKIKALDKDIRALMLEVVGAALGSAGRGMDEIEAESLEKQARRAEELVRLGYDSSYLDEIYSCKKCRDTGMLGSNICSCLMELYRLEQAKALSDLPGLGGESFDKFDLKWYSSAIDPAAGESPRQRMERILATCRAYAGSFGENSVNLLFRGGTGLGKTFLSACIARAVSEKGFSVVYDSALSILEAFEAQKFYRPGEENADAASRVRQILSCDLMILDDLGTEMLTSFSVSALYNIINTRLIRGKKTIISTNLSPEELRRRYSAQIVSRLEGEYLALDFIGRDIRMLKKEQGVL